jgi:Fe-Mn family superoxide dismutase
MTFKLTELPYDRGALEPHISARTLDYHYGKHHQAYVDNLNKETAGTRYEEMILEDVIQTSFKNKDKTVYNNASQAWNHTFLWDSMKPGGDGRPTGVLSGMINNQFGGLDSFRKQFRESAVGQFGSGWTWLIADEDTLAIVSTSDADSPLTTDTTPLLTLDVWEHAYYLDYQNSRNKYVDAFLEHLINWDFAQANLDALDARSQLRVPRPDDRRTPTQPMR